MPGRRYTVTIRTSLAFIKMCSDNSRCNVSLTVRDKVASQCPQTTTLEERGEQKKNRTVVLLAYQLNALPLDQLSQFTVKQWHAIFDRCCIALFPVLDQAHCASQVLSA